MKALQRYLNQQLQPFGSRSLSLPWLHCPKFARNGAVGGELCHFVLKGTSNLHVFARNRKPAPIPSIDRLIEKEMYQLTDQGMRNLGLRYDLTIPFAKVIAFNPGLEFPYKSG